VRCIGPAVGETALVHLLIEDEMYVAFEWRSVKVVLDPFPAVFIGERPAIPPEFDDSTTTPDELADGIASVDVSGCVEPFVQFFPTARVKRRIEYRRVERL